MKLAARTAERPASRPRGESGFTMIEIAIAIAVVAFALVAIIGVLPTGMTVQRDNREDTVLNQEGAYWLEAIRGGAHGIDDLTNYVESITISNRLGKVEVENVPGTPLTGQMIIGLLSTPAVIRLPDGTFITNRVTARVKAITGAASEKGPLINSSSFRYEIQSEVFDYVPPLVPGPIALTPAGQVSLLRNVNLANNLHQVRVILRWPVFERGDEWVTGNGRKYFRAAVAGGLTTQTNLVPGWSAYFLRQNTFTNATPL
jgi:type II secretory pathway pseudopilin PulG